MALGAGWSAVAATVGFAFACRSTPPPVSGAAESREACARRQREFVQLVHGLHERAVASAPRVAVPRSSVGAVPRNGPVLEVTASELMLDGQAVPGEPADRAARLEEWVRAWLAKTPAKPTVSVAAVPDVDVRTLQSYLTRIPDAVELELLVRVVAPPGGGKGARPNALQLSAALVAEQSPEKRSALALDAYRAFSTCAELDSAIRGTAASGSPWSARRTALLEALPRCDCGELDTASLEAIVVAEQRAESAGLGALPASFLRDPRCGASMPSRSLGKLVKQIESFDEEFSGSIQQDAVKFEQVLGNERLLNYFCDALPGETLAAQQRARATLYWRVPGSNTCQAWRFEPLSPGAPMGTWRRAGTPGAPELAFHYWQAAEEIKLFGPVTAESKPTDSRDWECQERFRMVGV
ncbi:MAG TPA: hypothetical protein VIM73_03730, partial [Polyangiaceae bacterium]